MQVGQSIIYAEDYPCRRVGRPIALDEVACGLPELKLLGITSDFRGPMRNNVVAPDGLKV